MKYTVLKMVQGILSAMDSDEVNSIGDTIEAQQVAIIVENCYNDITTDVELPDDYSILQLDPSLDSTKPVVMYIPQAYSSIEWIRYNKQRSGSTGSSSSTQWVSPDGLTVHFGQDEATFASSGVTGGNYQQFKEIVFLPREEFLDQVQSLDNSQSNVTTYTIDNVPYLCRNDKAPDYWTVLSNRTILFDSYDSNEDATLQAVKTMCYGKRATSFTMVDDWEIPLDDKYSSYLFNEAKATAFVELKQQANPRAEKQARLAKIKTQKSKNAAPYGRPAHSDDYDYGRHYLPNHYRKGYYT